MEEIFWRHRTILCFIPIIAMIGMTAFLTHAIRRMSRKREEGRDREVADAIVRHLCYNVFPHAFAGVGSGVLENAVKEIKGYVDRTYPK